MIKTLMREPLVHFLLLSVLIFAFSSSNGSMSEGDSTVVVTPDNVAHYMQSLDASLTREAALTKLRELPSEQRDYLLQQHIENEVLYREALHLGINEGDAVVRQRLIQRVRFMLQGLTTEMSITEQELADYFQRHQARYEIPEKMSFKHRFFKASGVDASRAKQKAVDALENSEIIQDDAFPYHKAYLDRTQAQIAQHFGESFATKVMQLEADAERWQGPIRSEFGYHLIRVTSKYDAKNPTINDVRARVLDDLKRAKTQERERAAVRELVAKYEIVEPDW